MAQAREARRAEQAKAEKAKALGFTPPDTGQTFQDISIGFLKHQKARLTPAAYERERVIVEGHLDSVTAVKGLIRRFRASSRGLQEFC